MLPTAITAKRTRRKISQGSAPTASKIYIHTVLGMKGFKGFIPFGLHTILLTRGKVESPNNLSGPKPKIKYSNQVLKN